MEDGRLLGVMVAWVDSGVLRGVVQYLDGFTAEKFTHFMGIFAGLQGRALLGVPVPLGTDAWSLTLQVAAPRPGDMPVLRQNFGPGQGAGRIWSCRVMNCKPSR